MPKTIPVTVTLPMELVKDVDKMAREKKVSRSQVVSEALKRRTWLWRLEQLQTKAKPYAEKLRIRMEEDVERILNK